MNLVKNVKQQWRLLVIGYYFMKLVKAPYGDFAGIGRLSNVITDASHLKLIAEFLSRHPQARSALQERPRLGKVDLQQLHQLPENTLGYLYADHMLKNGLTPPPTPETVDATAFASVHILETHDIWHVVTGCDTTKAGEIKLEAFYVAQIYPSALFLALLAKNLLKTAIEDIALCEEHMDALTQGWLLGKQAQPLFGIKWNTLWEVPLEQLRTQLDLNQPMSKVLAVAQVG
jgi:ubiquinone biosynthesis protein Coq4